MKNVELAIEVLKSGTQDKDLLGLAKVVIMDEFKDDNKIGDAVEKFGEIAFSQVVKKTVEKATGEKDDDGNEVMDIVEDGVEFLWDNKSSIMSLFG